MATNTNPTKQAMLELLVKLTKAVAETITETGSSGAPGGILYTALMSKGVDMQTYQMIMDTLLATGRFVKHGQVYFAKEFV